MLPSNRRGGQCCLATRGRVVLPSNRRRAVLPSNRREGSVAYQQEGRSVLLIFYVCD